MADNTFIFEVVTPERILLQDEAQFVLAPELTGYLGILKNHSPMIAALKIGVLRYTTEDKQIGKVSISGGFLEVVHNEVRVLAETAEVGPEIDVLRAKAAYERARKRLEASDSQINQARAQIALQRALARLKAADIEP